MPQPARWYVLADGEQTGPFGLRELRDRVLAGSVTPATWVWADGMAEWRRAQHVPALVPPPEHAPAGWLSSDADAWLSSDADAPQACATASASICGS